MTKRTFRITVRGSFDALTDEQRAGLQAEAAAHDVLRAEFTDEGHLTYDLAARPFFTFRFLEYGEEAEDVAAASVRAETAAELWLTERGYGYKNLKSQAQDMAAAAPGARQKQEARKKG
ncbi:hypothetical protein HUT16_32285 [Kitasatospora sp. NA04385]|uniref:DUF6204 family protein n=1 Tax=Kitasatospora sp. NA04385 TaxID=2742135 RepID=UPI00159170F1|nr:DUF6204 family protein [Kitasatospora sp. NA04385]QKW23141.1 hypothetical protein HUT16_32285 [Kitasatospora sp. NA04385]